MNIMTMSEAIAAYDAMLDEVGDDDLSGTILAGYSVSRILRAVDPIAYRVGFADWADAAGIDTDDLEDDEDLP
jgi:hypothetical protein